MNEEANLPQPGYIKGQKRKSSFTEGANGDAENQPRPAAVPQFSEPDREYSVSPTEPDVASFGSSWYVIDKPKRKVIWGKVTNEPRKESP